jgi:hypothetical protein
MTVNYIIKNKISERSFETLVLEWLSEGDYTPNDIIENITSGKNLFYVPIHFFKHEYSGSCSASLGYQRQEYYYLWDAYNKRRVQKSRLVTDWIPHSQNVQGVTSVSVYAGDAGLDFIAEFVENMGWGEADLQKPNNIDSVYQEYLQSFKFTIEASWSNQGMNKAYNNAVHQTIPLLPSKLVQNLALNIKFYRQTAFSLVVPYWVFLYDYKKRKYYVAVDGNNSSRISGSKPVDTIRKNKVMLLGWFGWIVGVLASLFCVFLFSECEYAKMKFTWRSSIIFALTFTTTWILVQSEIRSIKGESIKIRRIILQRKLNN